jgi:hypothetical protein
MRRKGWVETTATIESVYVDGGGDDRRISVVFMYTVDGHYYSGTYMPWGDTPVRGETISLRYDPGDPNKNDLVVKDTLWKWIGWIAILFCSDCQRS